MQEGSFWPPHLIMRGQAPRVDLNCGCPATNVYGNGAGSSYCGTPDEVHKLCGKPWWTAASRGRAPWRFLRTPEKLHSCVAAMVNVSSSRAAALVREAGASFVTLHPRTKAQSYRGLADWGLIAHATQVLDIPVVGNGDVVSAVPPRPLAPHSQTRHN
eukprot:gene31082-6208_t